MLILAAVALLAAAPMASVTHPSTIDRDGRAGRMLGPTMEHVAVEARSVVSPRAGKPRNARARVAVPAVVAVVFLVLASILLGPVQMLLSSMSSERSGHTWRSRAPPAHIQPA
jgi:hypothetical protein